MVGLLTVTGIGGLGLQAPVAPRWVWIAVRPLSERERGASRERTPSLPLSPLD